MGADHLIALAVVASPGAPERKPRRDVESRGGDHRDGDDDDENRDAERDRPGMRRALRAGMLGVQWGIGHALGLALVCAVFFATRRRMNLDDFGDYADKAVGASMIALGLISLWHLRRWRTRRERERAHIVDERVAGAGDPEVHDDVASASASQLAAASAPSRHASPAHVALVLEAGSEEHAAAHDMRLPHIHVPRVSSPSSSSSSPAKPASSQLAAAERVTSPGGAARFGEQKIDENSEAEESSTDDKSRRGWSMSIGLVHGVAGPSGILAVLPAVVLADAGKSAAYLVAFFVASATAMGAFAAIFGYVTDLAVRRQMDDDAQHDGCEDVGAVDSRERRVTRATDAATRVAMGLNLGAGVLAVAVGTLWLALSGLGLLGSL